MIFAAKTTAAGLIALLIAFAFNLDQPQWALLTVFIVSQPELSGPVFAKALYRVIGTVIGASVALLLVALFAQERVLFLGALALWIGSCTFGSQYARNFGAYSFVLSGYTAAIVGIPAALEPDTAFYVASARITEVCLGIIVAAAVNRIILPSSASAALWQSVAAARQALIDHVAILLDGGDATKSTALLVSSAIAIENQRASAVFEGREVRDRSTSLRLLNLAMLRVAATTQSVVERLGYLRQTDGPIAGRMDDLLSAAVSALKLWQSGAFDADGLGQKLRESDARARLAEELFPTPSTNGVTLARATARSALHELFDAISAYAMAYESCISGKAVAPEPIPVSRAYDLTDALWAGLRAAVAVALVGCFWILSAWPHGSTALILLAVANARLATIGRGVPIALAAVMIFTLATIPAFVVVEVLLPLASGFLTFALAVGPVLFGYAFLMSRPNPKTKLVGYLSALLFASVGQFQNSMVYDPVGLLNTSIAAVFAAGVTLVLWSVVAPATPEAARQRFLRVARHAVSALTAARSPIGIIEFKTRIAEALDQLQGGLSLNQPADLADLAAAIRLLVVGSDFKERDAGGGVQRANLAAQISASYTATLLQRYQAQFPTELDKEELRNAA
ncbi:MAG: FUSC family protein [Methylobacteriaceae bacterium]|nr:FUSC family protein [Methylobacteriaceae bacterium]